MPTGWRLSGTAAFSSEGSPVWLDYFVECGFDWRTQRAKVIGWTQGMRRVFHDISVTKTGRWLMDGREYPELDSCVDVDLNFSPITNTLPIRRLELKEGDSAEVQAAWLRYPSFALEKLSQTYRREGPRQYLYTSANGAFRANLTVDDAGLAVDYPPFWSRMKAV